MATLKDIAKHTNMSVTTVSRVISGDSTLRLSEANRQKILKCAADLNYISKKKNVGTKVEIISWIPPELEYEDNYYYNIRRRIQSLLAEHKIDYHISFREEGIYKLLDKDAVVVIGDIDFENATKIQELCSNFIIIDSNPKRRQFNSIELDYSSIAEQIIELFEQTTYQKIIYISSKYFKIQQHLENSGIAVQKIECGHDMEEAYEAMTKLSNEDLKNSLIYCDNDILTVGVSRQLHERNYVIGSEVGLIGTNNLKVSKYNYPSISTFDTNQRFIGDEAVRLIKGNKLSENNIINLFIQPTLIERESTILID